MTDHQHASQADRRESERSVVEMLKPLGAAVWKHRRVLLLVILLTVVIFTLVGGVSYVRQPSEHTVSVPFRPTFDGAKAGKYPSGLIYDSADIVAPPVLKAAFDANDVKRYVDFDRFANSVAVLRTSDTADMIAADFRGRLSDTRLSAVDRSRIEDDFRSRMQSVPLEYRLTVVASAGNWDMPDVVMQKVLSDVLANWEKQSVDLRGAMSYQLEVITEAAFEPSEFANMEPLRRLDTLREKIRRLIHSIQQLEELPGGKVVRDGAGGVSLPEIRATLEDLLRYRVDPGYGQILSAGHVVNPRDVSRYFADQLRHIQRRAAEANGRRQALDQTLRTYLDSDSRIPAPAGEGVAADTRGSGAPLSESVIDRLMALGSRQEDMQFRQKLTARLEEESLAALELGREVEFYQSVAAAVSAAGAGSGGDTQPAAALVDDLTQVARQAATRANHLYRQMNQRNLNPQGRIYEISGPFSSRIERSLTLSQLGVYLLTTLAAVALAAAAGILIFHFGRRELVARRARSAN